MLSRGRSAATAAAMKAMPADDGHAVGKQERPLVAEQRAAAEDDDKLCRTGEQGPYAEDYEDIFDGAGRGHTKRDGGDGADRGIRE
jgi:hypothetical protein